MFFKPRIFISSTLSENLEIRDQLLEYFKSIGAEVLLYEKNLTPSNSPFTYRKDILEADFVILIVKDQYGTPTDTGISGTHEEFNIILQESIPKHIYIKKDSEEKPSEKLIDEINKNNISFYYFENDNDLFKRVKETTFIIAKEIVLDKVKNAKLPRNTVKQVCCKYDYEQALEIIKIINEMIDLQINSGYDYVDSDIFDSFIEPIELHKRSRGWLFVNGSIEKAFDELLSIYNRFSETHGLDYTTAGNHREYEVAVLGNVMISYCNVGANPKKSHKDYCDLVEEFLEKFCEFKELISNMKLDADTLI